MVQPQRGCVQSTPAFACPQAATSLRLFNHSKALPNVAARAATLGCGPTPLWGAHLPSRLKAELHTLGPAGYGVPASAGPAPPRIHSVVTPSNGAFEHYPDSRKDVQIGGLYAEDGKQLP